MTRRPARRLAALAALVCGFVLAGAGAASAHVSVDAGGARQGSTDAVLTFRVPNERAGATTVEVNIKLPSRTPVGSVKPAPKAGWTVTTTRVTYEVPITTVDGTISEGVGQVVYKATSAANGIPEGGFDTFQLLVGPLPTGVATLPFPTVQKYSNGQVSSWIEPSIAGTEPSHPAPLLTLPPAEPAAAPAVPAAGPASPVGSPVPAGTALGEVPTEDDVRTARLLGILGVVTGSLGLLAAGIAIGRVRRSAPSASTDSAD